MLAPVLHINMDAIPDQVHTDCLGAGVWQHKKKESEGSKLGIVFLIEFIDCVISWECTVTVRD